MIMFIVVAAAAVVDVDIVVYMFCVEVEAEERIKPSDNMYHNIDGRRTSLHFCYAPHTVQPHGD